MTWLGAQSMNAMFNNMDWSTITENSGVFIRVDLGDRGVLHRHDRHDEEPREHRHEMTTEF